MIKEYLNCGNCSQKECLINKHCSIKWKVKVSEHKPVISYQKGHSIFCENSFVYGIYFIFRGKVKVYNTGRNQKQYILRLAGSGEMLGMRAYAEKKYRVSCMALEETLVCFIDKEIYIECIKENPELSLSLIQNYAQTLSSMDLRQKHLAQLCSKDRIAEALLIIKKHFGIATKEGILLDVNLSRQDIANMAGIAMEETNRILAAFKKEKIIEYNTMPKKIVIRNPAKLMTMILNNYDDIYQQECCEILL